MWKNFVRIFEKEGVDNVVWIMDYSFNVRNQLQVAIDLWPEDNVVQWLFFNIFQFKDTDDCPGGLNTIYNNF